MAPKSIVFDLWFMACWLNYLMVFFSLAGFAISTSPAQVAFLLKPGPDSHRKSEHCQSCFAGCCGRNNASKHLEVAISEGNGCCCSMETGNNTPTQSNDHHSCPFCPGCPNGCASCCSSQLICVILRISGLVLEAPALNSELMETSLLSPQNFQNELLRPPRV